MDVKIFKDATRLYKSKLTQPGVTLETFREILTFLGDTLDYREDVDHIALRRAFSNSLRTVVNPYRHQRFLSRFREPADLQAIRPWLEVWIDALAVLGPNGMAVPDWHAAYDRAVYRALSAFASMRRNRAEQASDAWTEAATICRAWLNNHADLNHTSGYKKLDASYHLFEAYAWRARGEAALDRHPSTAQKFDDVANLFASGAIELSKSIAKVIETGQRVNPQEGYLLTYLEHLCRYRSALLQQDFCSAAKHLAELGSVAPFLTRLAYFDDLTVLKAEAGFLRAFELLRDGNITGARVSAEEMLTASSSPSPDLLRRKWRRLRVYALRLLDGDATALDYIDSLFGKGHGLGGAAHHIRNACRDFAAGRLSLDAAASALLAVFPLDAHAAKFTLDHDDPILDIFPEVYRVLLDELEPTPEGADKLLFLVWQYSANIAEYLCGLYELKRARGEFVTSVELPSSFHLTSFSSLQDTLVKLGLSLDWAEPHLRKLSTWISEALTLDLSKVVEFREKSVALFGDISIFLFPHAVRVRAQEFREDGEVLISLDRLWCRDSKSLQLICTGPKDLVTEEFYLLKPSFIRYQADIYHERSIGQVTFYKATTLGAPSAGKFCLLVEGRFDVRVFARLMDEFLPYWRARVILESGNGDSLPKYIVDLKAKGYDVTVVADADKRRVWRTPEFYLEPDLEGVDTKALAEAVMKLGGHRLDG
ncbi:MAG TPA: hypothetical protein VF179_20210 [Thermoanaerobaculia bacterium]|nr:hypothetical protein [Thermoanaerobaculia bacterium]